MGTMSNTVAIDLSPILIIIYSKFMNFPIIPKMFKCARGRSLFIFK